MPKSTRVRRKQSKMPKRVTHLKTDLFVKIQDLQGINQELEKIMLMPQYKRLQWANEHEIILTSLLDTFIEDSMMVVDGLDNDDQTIDLSIEYVGSLKDVVYKVRSILYEQDQLES